MRPAVGLGRPLPNVNVETLLDVIGKVRYTAININPQPFRNGKLSLYEENGLYYLICSGKADRRFQLSKKIKNISTRAGHITIVLNDGYQIIAKECQEKSVALLELSLNEIKEFGSLKSLAYKKGLHSAEDKNNTSDRITSNVKKTPPFTSQRKNGWITSPLLSTPSKSPHSRGKQLDKVKGRLLDTPFCNKENKNGRGMLGCSPTDSICIEDEEVSWLTKSNQTASWSRPPGEKRTHSPVLKYNCSPSSSPLGFSTIKTKSPKVLKRIPQQAMSSPKDRDFHFTDDFDEGNNWRSSAIRTPLSCKRTYGSRKSCSPSPLRPKMLQEENQASAHHRSSEQDEATHKVSSFYGAQKPLFSSLSGKKLQSFNWSGRGLKRLLPDAAQKHDMISPSFSNYDAASNQTNQSGLTGFANLGNTCYMNAILQCLLGTPVFAHDLENPFLLQNVAKSSLYNCLHALEKAKRKNENQEKQHFILRNVKRAISNKAARFSGEMQHDAHEFLGQCLDQLKDDIMKPFSVKDGDDTMRTIHEDERKKREAACPVAKNFECQITHNIKCNECGNTITKEEVFYDFSLDIPERDENTDPDDKDLQELLHEYFKEETIKYKCEKCEHENALLSHHISRLPRVIILHLKRYELNSTFSKYKKKMDSVDVPLEIDLGVLCTEKTVKPLHFDKTPNGGIKRPISNETPDDVNELQPCFKARRKLSLTPNPILSNPENEGTGLAFEQDTEKAINLSLDTVTEEEQLEWALAESMKTEQQSASKMEVVEDDYLPASFLEIEPLSRNGDKHNMKYKDIRNSTNSSESFTGLKERSQQAAEVEASRANYEKAESETSKIFPEAQNKTTENENFMEGISQQENEDYQLELALKLSLKEYNKQSAEKLKLTEMQCRSNERMKMAKKRDKITTDVNGINRRYRLIGVVSHIGDSSVVGHYTSDVYDCKESEWKSYDDLNVKKITEYEVQYGRKKSAYIFFYIDEACFKLITNAPHKPTS